MAYVLLEKDDGTKYVDEESGLIKKLKRDGWKQSKKKLKKLPTDKPEVEDEESEEKGE